MIFSDEFLNEIKEKNEILDVVSAYTSLIRNGKNSVALCPFHAEKTPSFFVYPESNSFYCFGCGAGGDVLTFIMLAEKLEYNNAVEFLANRVGLELSQKNEDGFLSRKKIIYEINRESARFFHKYLFTSNGKFMLDYIFKRGVKKETVVHFGIGGAPAIGSELVNFLKNYGFSFEEIISANLGVLKQNGNIYDRFASRIMFPIISVSGNVLAFGGRSINNNFGPKYLNSSDTPVFKKSVNLFALNFAKKSSKKGLILTEGYMDTIALHQTGFDNVVATLGTSFTREQANLLSKYSNKIYVAYDSDLAGKKAVERAIKILREIKISPKIVNIKNAKDPDEFVKISGKDANFKFNDLLEKSQSDINYRLMENQNLENLENNTEYKIEYAKKAAKILAEIDSPIERDIYISKICSQTDIQKNAFELHVNKLRKDKFKFKSKKVSKNARIRLSDMYDKTDFKKNINLRSAYIEEFIISYIIKNGVLNISNLSSDDFIMEFNRKIFEKILDLSKQKRTIDIGSISKDLDFKQKGKIAKIANSFFAKSIDNKEILGYIEKLKYERKLRDFKNSEELDKSEVLSFLDKLRVTKQ
ncbi:MAG: DNA primase [Oscillospiraceae bacterium]|jgi:DNA primase|nr:DNA primase [Oscillospiraceae bacterium]